VNATRPLLAVAAALVLACAGNALAGAQDDGSVTDGPTVSLERTVVSPGDIVMVTLTGWSGREVTLSVCGNRAARGSQDCNLVASQGVPLNRDQSPTLVQFPITPPTLSCPCVVRASSTRNENLAIAPFELLGHPVGPVVEAPVQNPLSITVASKRAPGSLLSTIRTTLGGPTSYEVTVTVTNRTTDTLRNVVVAAAAGRGRNDDVSDVELPAVGDLAPGQTWEYTAHPTVPAPILGAFIFQATASGAGPPVHAEQTTGAPPIGLLVMALVLVLDVIAIVWRRVARRRHRAMAGLDQDLPRLAPDASPRPAPSI
jgi:hypothetical protein